MTDKRLRIVASKVFDRTARHAFSMKMTAAITRSANVLINVATALGAVKFLYDVGVAQLGQVAVDAAPASCGVAVDCKTDLLRCELSIGILRKEITDLTSSGSLIQLFFHRLSSLSFIKFENSSQIITQNQALVNTI